MICPEANSVRCGGKSATNRLSYGTALGGKVNIKLNFREINFGWYGHGLD
jgi:hypothetical protein